MYLKSVEKIFRLIPPTFVVVISIIAIAITYYVLETKKQRDIDLLKQKTQLENKFHKKELLNNFNSKVNKRIDKELTVIKRNLREHTFKIIGGLKHHLEKDHDKSVLECLKDYEEKNKVYISVFSEDVNYNHKLIHGDDRIAFLSKLIFGSEEKSYKDFVLKYLSSQGRYNMQEWRNDLKGTLKLSFFDILEDKGKKYYIGTFSDLVDIKRITKNVIIDEINKTEKNNGHYFWLFDVTTKEGYNFTDEKKYSDLDTILKLIIKENQQNFLDQLLGNKVINEFENSLISNDKKNKLSIVLEFTKPMVLDTSAIDTRYRFTFVKYTALIVLSCLLIVILVRHFSFFIKVQLDARELQRRVDREVAKNREKDRILVQQSKLAAMGEMLGNIAHQWRQPLNNVSLFLQFIESNYTNKQMDKKLIKKYFKKSFVQINYMSQTIDDFRNFYKPSKEKTKFNLQQAIEGSVEIIAIQLQNDNIELIEKIDDIELVSFENELKQSILNILNNAQHAIKEKKNTVSFNPYIKIKVKKQDNTVLIDISNNGGEIDQTILPRIFEPYFTTKFEAQGTGVGLYMTKSIVEVNLQGTIEVENFTDGVSFKITLPYDIKDQNGKC